MATTEKAELKILVANNIGADLENMLEIAQAQKQQHEGARVALTEASKAVAGLAEHFERSCADGQIDLEAISGDVGATRQLVLRYIARASGLLSNLALNAQSQTLMAEGMAVAYKRSMNVASRLISSEKAKLDALAEPQVEGEADPKRPVARADGQHPGNPLLARRVAEVQPKRKPGRPKGSKNAKNAR